MKQNIIKRLTTFFLCSILALPLFTSTKTFANLDDMEIVGGRYEELMNVKSEYKKQNPDDKNDYECHHLIAKKALNLWGDEIWDRCKGNEYNKFIVNNKNQGWAPSIIMEKADHEKTLSYYDEKKRMKEQNFKAIRYINKQAQRIIEEGNVIGVLKDEVKFIRKTFGHKYDRAINQMWRYVVEELQFRHTDSHTLMMNNPYKHGWFLYYNFGK